MARGGARAHWAREGARSGMRGGDSFVAPAGAVLAVLILALAAGLCLVGPAAAKSYSIDDVRIVAAVKPNGDLLVGERRTFSFEGSFHFVYWDISTQGSGGIKVLGVDGPNGALERSGGAVQEGYTVVPRGESVRVKAFWPMSTSDTFTLRYRALDAARRYEDTGELYWQFVGDGWGAPTRKADILVSLPGDVKKAQVRAWGHGPLNGSVKIRLDGSVFYSVREVPPRTFVEGRILFPAAALSRVPVIHTDRLAAALAAEKHWADEANALRRRVIAEREAATRGQSRWRGVGVIAPALLVLLLLLVTLSKGLGYRLGGRGETSMDIPDESSPALVAMLWEPREFVRTAVPATLLDLVQRGVLALEPVPPASQATIRRSPATASASPGSTPRSCAATSAPSSLCSSGMR